MGKLAYRPHIDGLRAIAVSGVLIFHFGGPLKGGFLGVDVFYVISGYLIFKTILSDLNARTFSFADFYQRRLRRIFPAYAAVTLVVAALSYSFLLPTQLVNFEESLVAAATFTTNFYFYGTTSYFSPSATSVPLLHYWTLAVEEQFYLLFPLAVVLLNRLGFRTLLIVMALTGFGSLIACELIGRFDPAAAFYLLPCRAFELLIGSLTAIKIPPAHLLRARSVADTAILLGVTLIVGAMLLIDDTRPPGLVTLVPCLGTAAVIWGGEHAYGSRYVKVLTFRPLVHIGKISYSLYLIHWPIVVFSKALGAEIEGLGFLVLATGASVALAWFSYEFIEKPARNATSTLRTRRLIAYACSATVFFLISAGVIIHADGFQDRLDATKRQVLAYEKYDYAPDWRAGICFMAQEQTYSELNAEQCAPNHDTDVVLWGSSLIAHFNFGLQQLLKGSGISYAQLTAASCSAYLGFDFPGYPNCRNFNEAAFAAILSAAPKVVVVEGPNGSVDKINEAMLHAGIRVIAIGMAPYYRDSVPVLVAQRLATVPFSELSDSDVLPPAQFEADREASAHLAGLPGVRFVSLLKEGCPNQKCPMAVNKIPLDFDRAHFTRKGSEYYSSFLFNAIKDELIGRRRLSRQ